MKGFAIENVELNITQHSLHAESVPEVGGIGPFENLLLNGGNWLRIRELGCVAGMEP